MGLKNVIRKAAGTAFAVVDDLAEDFTFETRTADGQYDYHTGKREVAIRSFTLRGIKSDRPTRTIDGGLAQEGDLSLLIQNTKMSVAVKVNTEMTDTSGRKWLVVGIDRDPADATIEFLLRRRGV